MELMARAAGIEVVSSAELREKYMQSDSDGGSGSNNEEGDGEQSDDSVLEASDLEDGESDTTDDEKPTG